MACMGPLRLPWRRRPLGHAGSSIAVVPACRHPGMEKSGLNPDLPSGDCSHLPRSRRRPTDPTPTRPQGRLTNELLQGSVCRDGTVAASGCGCGGRLPRRDGCLQIATWQAGLHGELK